MLYNCYKLELYFTLENRKSWHLFTETAKQDLYDEHPTLINVLYRIGVILNVIYLPCFQEPLGKYIINIKVGLFFMKL